MAKSKLGSKLGHGRGTGIPRPVDVHVGARLRQRRTLLGMNAIRVNQGPGRGGEQGQLGAHARPHHRPMPARHPSPGRRDWHRHGDRLGHGAGDGRDTPRQPPQRAQSASAYGLLCHSRNTWPLISRRQSTWARRALRSPLLGVQRTSISGVWMDGEFQGFSLLHKSKTGTGPRRVFAAYKRAFPAALLR